MTAPLNSFMLFNGLRDSILDHMANKPACELAREPNEPKLAIGLVTLVLYYFMPCTLQLVSDSSMSL